MIITRCHKKSIATCSLLLTDLVRTHVTFAKNKLSFLIQNLLFIISMGIVVIQILRILWRRIKNATIHTIHLLESIPQEQKNQKRDRVTLLRLGGNHYRRKSVKNMRRLLARIFLMFGPTRMGVHAHTVCALALRNISQIVHVLFMALGVVPISKGVGVHFIRGLK